jgi:hypothetical protein
MPEEKGLDALTQSLQNSQKRAAEKRWRENIERQQKDFDERLKALEELTAKKRVGAKSDTTSE